MPPSPRLTVIVLNFRTPDVTIDCLKTLAPEAAANPGMKVVLLDNASGDDSVPRIEAAIRENGWGGGWLEFRSLDKNLGFAACHSGQSRVISPFRNCGYSGAWQDRRRHSKALWASGQNSDNARD